MSAEAKQDPEKKAPAARRGPRKEADIRAEVEAELRKQMEVELAQARTELLSKMEAEREQAEADAKLSRAAAAEATPLSAEQIDGDPTKQDAKVFHFLEDGLTILGRVWYRGEELTLNPGTEQWDEAISVMEMDEYEQESRWGRRFFRSGPWRGKRLDQINDPELTDAEREQLKKAAVRRDQRYGSL